MIVSFHYWPFIFPNQLSIWGSWISKYPLSKWSLIKFQNPLSNIPYPLLKVIQILIHISKWEKTALSRMGQGVQHTWFITLKISISWQGYYKKKQTLWPLFMDGVQLPQGYSHFKEAVYFLPFSSQKFTFYHSVTIWVTINDSVITHTDTEVFYSILTFTVYWVREIMVLKLNVSRMGQISPTKQLSI